MKRKLRKSLSWLLTVAMIFSLFCGMIPTASAVDDLEIEEYHFMDRDAFEDLCLRKLGYDRDDMRPGTYVTITSIQLIASDGSKNTAAAGDDEQFDMYNQHGYLTVGESAGEFIQPQDVAEIKVLINYWPTDEAISQSTYVSLSMDDFETTSFPEAKYVELRVKEDEKPSPDEEPDAPSVIQLQSLFADQIKVTCDNHHQTIAYGLNDVENGYSAPGEGVTKEEDVWTYTVTINYDPFVTKYSNDVVDGNDVETHALVNPSVTTEAVKLVWGSEGWAAAENQLPVVIETICTNPQVDYIQVNMSSAVKERYDSFGEGTSVRWIHIDLTKSSSTWPHYYVMLGDDTRRSSGNTSANEIVGVTLGATLIEDRMYFSMSEDNGEYAQIEVSYGYDGDDYIMYLYCQLVEERDPGPEPGTLTLTYNYNNATDTTTSTTEVDSNTYATGATPSLKTAVSDTIDTVDDDVVFVGWTQDKNHYTKSAPATVKPDNLVTSVTFEAENITVYAAWAQDANNDGTPDYRQVFIEYVSNDIALGTVTPLRQTVTLGLGENGQPDTTNPIYLTGKATAVDGASFSYWMINDDITASYSADLQTAGYFLDNYTAGQTYVMKAYFMDEDIGKPEGPNTYSIYVKVENGTATFNGAVIDNYVFAGEGEDIAINFTGNENYVIDKATIDGVDYTEYLKYDESYTFKAVSQSHMITVIYAADEKGAWDDNGNEQGDGIPDKYQKKVTFQVVNGTWADGTRTDKIEYVTLTDESGKYSESGKGSLNAPTGMIADTGFQNGAWDTVLPTEVRGTEDATYTYTFSAIPVTYYNVTFNTNGGTTPSWSQSVVQGQAVNEPTDPVWNDDYIFMGWTTETIPGRTYGVGASLPDMVFQNSTPFTPAGNTTLYAVWGEDRNHDDVADVYEVFIAPADITIYTGGTGYEGVSDGAGNEIQNSNSGLPEPGFHITLPDDLGLGNGNDLNGIVKFRYNGFDRLTNTWVTREWNLSCVGVYSAELGQFVYSLVSTGDTPAVRVTYTGENGEAVEHDRIDMSANAASAKYDISINAGGLEQNNIEAVITVGGREVTRSLVIGTGELTIRSTVDDNTTPIAGNEDEVSGGSFTAVDTGASYKVNDSEVDVPTTGDRVHLLVDEVSDSPDFNNAMGEAALDHANMPNASYETAYLDLVDSQNGNTVVTLDNGSMDIYWPMPSDADPSGTFQVVHYRDMNRENTVDADNLAAQTTEVLTGTPVYTNGNWYVRFNTNSFSPFVLVYEEKAQPVNPGHGGSGGGHDNDDSDPTGNLSIELDVNGGDDEFTFTVILTDKDGDDLENNFYYNGDYTGTIGSGDEITLEGGDKIVIRNLPEGTRYEVIIETADGYTYVIDGEEGVIHTGMNEAEFTATRTVPVADPSVTGVSRWLNTTDHIAYLTGYPGGAFGPDNNMTRAEVAQMFYALLNNKNVTITKTFPDVPADAWYATAVNTLASLGMVSGDENGNYRPNDPITRAEFCVIALAFAYEPENAVCYFGDVSRSDWFYTYVAQAASYGWIGGYTNGNFGPNDRITRAQVTTIVNNMLGRAADRDYVIDHQADLVQFTDLTRAHWGYFQIMEATNAHDYTKSNGTENWR